VTAFAPILQSYFTQRLAQRQAGPHTVASYRDTFSLLLRFAQQQLGKPPSRLDVTDVDAPFIGAFLDHLETERGNCAATRNNRLAAVHSLFSYAALRCPEHAATIGRVLAIPAKRTDTTIVCFLTNDEIEALLASPDRATRPGRRDHLLLLVAAQTGLRVSELTGLTRGDVTLGAGANLRCRGKGRKERATPLTRPTAQLIGGWLTEHPGEPTDPLFPNRAGARLSPDAVADLLTKHITTAARRSPVAENQASLAAHAQTHRRDDPPPRRRGHLNDRAVARPRRDQSDAGLPARRPHAQGSRPGPHRTAPPAVGRARYHPPDRLLAFLESL
jgi:Site-specific recombinase XerD